MEPLIQRFCNALNHDFHMCRSTACATRAPIARLLYEPTTGDFNDLAQRFGMRTQLD